MNQRRFTLIEILVAISIIILLAGSVAVIVPGVMRRARRARAETQITALENAIRNFQMDNGYYPDAPGSPYQLTQAAWWNELTDQNNRPYVDWDSAGFPQHPTGYRVDPWDRPFYYRRPGVNNTGSFDLWSAGPDGQSGTADDIGNWR